MSENNNPKNSQHDSTDGHDTSPIFFICIAIGLVILGIAVIFKDKISNFITKYRCKSLDESNTPNQDTTIQGDEAERIEDSVSAELKQSQEETPIKIPEEIPEKITRQS